MHKTKVIFLLIPLLALGLFACEKESDLNGKWSFLDSNDNRGILWILNGEAMHLDERIYDIQLFDLKYTHDSIFFIHPALAEPYMQASYVKEGNKMIIDFGGLEMKLDKQSSKVSIPKTSAEENAVYSEFASFLRSKK